MKNNEYFGQYEGVVTVNGTALDPRNDLKNHSPDGFSWGYGGSGVAQLSLAVLAHEYDPLFALANYQEFKWRVFAHCPQMKNWRLSSAEIREFFDKGVIIKLRVEEPTEIKERPSSREGSDGGRRCTPGHEQVCMTSERRACRCNCGGENHGKHPHLF